VAGGTTGADSMENVERLQFIDATTRWMKRRTKTHSYHRQLSCSRAATG
jgi:hypothetical protein